MDLLGDRAGWEYALEGAWNHDGLDYALLRLRGTTLEVAHWVEADKLWRRGYGIRETDMHPTCLSCGSQLDGDQNTYNCPACGVGCRVALPDFVRSLETGDSSAEGKIFQEMGEVVQDEISEEKARSTDPAPANDTKKKKDHAMARYEKALDMAIETTAQNKDRFPITLFGYAITTGILVTWMLLAATPVFNTAKTMAVPLVKAGCQLITESDLVGDASLMLEHVSEVESEILSKAIGENVSQIHFSLTRFIEDAVCKPLEQLINRMVDKAVQASEETIQGLNITAAVNDRRLESLPPLWSLVETWWQATPGEPRSKLALLNLELEALELRARWWLHTVPRAIQGAHKHGTSVALNLALRHENYQYGTPWHWEEL